MTKHTKINVVIAGVIVLLLTGIMFSVNELLACRRNANERALYLMKVIVAVDAMPTDSISKTSVLEMLEPAVENELASKGIL